MASSPRSYADPPPRYTPYAAGRSPFEMLPAELLAAIFDLLPPTTLRYMNLVSRSAYNYASTVLWRDLDLVDCDRVYDASYGFDPLSTQSFHKAIRNGQDVVIDDHDDTPMIRKLYLLATNPSLANRVRTVTHRCHLPTPAIFAELPHMSFSDQTLSSDARTIALLRFAILNMVGVHTLRIIFPHYNICNALLTGFFDSSRPKNTPIRRLWLESCDIQFDLSTTLLTSLPPSSAGPQSPTLDATDLRSLRVRRLRLDPTITPKTNDFHFTLARQGALIQMQDGRGSMYSTTISEQTPRAFNRPGPLPDQIEPARRDSLYGEASKFYNQQIYSTLGEVKSFLNGKGLGWNVSPLAPALPDTPPSCYNQSTNITTMLDQSSHNLTSLNLDWLMLMPGRRGSDESLVVYDFFQTLSRLKFYHLRAFQLRNTVCPSTAIPENIYLLEPTTVVSGTGHHDPVMTCEIDFLSFLENHTKLECLAWPLDRVFAKSHSTSKYFERAKAAAVHLGGTLKTLRLDTYFESSGEDQTDNREDIPRSIKSVRTRRRLFIEYFAPHMRVLKTLKLEGGIPRDEKREILRAMYRCPLEKITMIGVTFPLGNNWGKDGIDIQELQDEDGLQFNCRLEAEDSASVMASRKLQPLRPPENFEFRPTFGWPPSPPLLFNIASLFSSTVKELKFCGYNGSVVMNSPEVRAKGVTPGILHHLRYFHNLESIVTSFIMLNQLSDSAVIQQWLVDREVEEQNIRMSLMPAQVDSNMSGPPSPASYRFGDSLQPLVGEASWDEGGSEESLPLSTTSNEGESKEDLRRRLYSGLAIAQQVDETLRPYLSSIALGRKEGVSVRASFCMGADLADVFDMEVNMDKNGVVGFRGPREEGERDRWFGKLNTREYF